jgi:hypothetical protein
MTDQNNSAFWRREELLSLLQTSGSLAGLCIMVVALMNTFDKTRTSVSLVDDIFCICTVAYLLNIYLIFWALRTSKTTTSVKLVKISEAVFLFALTFMTLAAFLMIYTIL